MSDWYKATFRQGKRSDSIEFESPSITKAKNLVLSVSTSNVTSMKKVVYSKDKDINYGATNHVETKYNDLLIACVETSKRSHIIKMKFPKRDLDLLTVKEKLKKFKIDGLKIERIITVLIKKHEGFSPRLAKD
jgi:hypothetical protein